MDNQEWVTFRGLIAFSPDGSLYVNPNVAGIHELIILIDGLRVVSFPDELESYLAVEDVIEWHLNETQGLSQSGRFSEPERLWHRVAATEFSLMKKRFRFGVPESIVPDSLFSDEYVKQVALKAKREGNKVDLEELQQARPDLSLNGLSVENKKSSSAKTSVRSAEKDIYFIQGCETERVKIGISNNVDQRLKGIQSSEPLKLLGIIKDGGKKLETELHERFKSFRVHGEWFDPAPELLSYIHANVVC